MTRPSLRPPNVDIFESPYQHWSQIRYTSGFDVLLDLLMRFTTRLCLQLLDGGGDVPEQDGCTGSLRVRANALYATYLRPRGQRLPGVTRGPQAGRSARSCDARSGTGGSREPRADWAGRFSSSRGGEPLRTLRNPLAPVAQLHPPVPGRHPPSGEMCVTVVRFMGRLSSHVTMSGKTHARRPESSAVRVTAGRASKSVISAAQSVDTPNPRREHEFSFEDSEYTLGVLGLAISRSRRG